MREALAILAGSHLTVRAVVLKTGYSVDHRPTLLLANVADTDGNRLCDHLWVVATKRMIGLELQIGDSIELRGLVRSYTHRGKRPLADRLDFTLRYCTGCRVVARLVAPVDDPSQPPSHTSIVFSLIAELWQQHGTPPPFAKVCNKASLTPRQALKALQQLANAGRVAFTAVGCVYTISREEYAS